MKTEFSQKCLFDRTTKVVTRTGHIELGGAENCHVRLYTARVDGKLYGITDVFDLEGKPCGAFKFRLHDTDDAPIEMIKGNNQATALVGIVQIVSEQ